MNSRSTTLAAVHLYNAARQTALMPTTWPEMERLIASWPSPKLFVGQPPTDISGCFRQYLLVSGVSSVSFAKTPRSRGKFGPYTMSGKKHREPFGHSPTLQRFLEWYCRGDAQTDIRAEHIEALVNTLSKHSSQYRTSHRQGNGRGATSLTERLDLLQDAIKVEEPVLNVKYFRLHDQILEMLHELERSLHEPFMTWFKEGTTCHPNQVLWALPEFIFETMLAKKPWIRDFGEKMFSLASRLMERFSDKQDDREDVKTIPGHEDALVVPEMSAATLWGILEPNHPTYNGECIHVGVCERQVVVMERGPASLWGILKPYFS